VLITCLVWVAGSLHLLDYKDKGVQLGAIPAHKGHAVTAITSDDSGEFIGSCSDHGTVRDVSWCSMAKHKTSSPLRLIPSCTHVVDWIGHKRQLSPHTAPLSAPPAPSRYRSTASRARLRRGAAAAW
jgi:hypothetical protein